VYSMWCIIIPLNQYDDDDDDTLTNVRLWDLLLFTLHKSVKFSLGGWDLEYNHTDFMSHNHHQFCNYTQLTATALDTFNFCI